MEKPVIYSFTREQLWKQYKECLEMFIEYRDKHGRTEDAARTAAICEMLDGLDAEKVMWAFGEIPDMTLQQPPGD